MKTKHTSKNTALLATFAAVVVLVPVPLFSQAAVAHGGHSGVVTLEVEHDDDAPAKRGTGTKHAAVVVKAIEPSSDPGHTAQRELPWLGVSAEEASDVVNAQLGLDPGVGLVVAFVAKDSPAATAGLQKNDVLVGFDDQSLVHPAQLRRLVQTRKEGDRVKLAFYRGGKKQTVTATLGKTTPGLGLLDGEHAWQGDLHELLRQVRELPIGDTIREQVKVLRDAYGSIQFEHKGVQEEIRRSMAEARKALQEALQNMTNANGFLGPARQALRDLEDDIRLDNKTTITVRNSGQTVKSIVKTDEFGTITLISNPKLILTAHDKEGILLFDGEIETPDQRAKVPPEVWERAEPLLKKLETTGPEEDEVKVEADAAIVPSGHMHHTEERLLLDASPRISTRIL